MAVTLLKNGDVLEDFLPAATIRSVNIPRLTRSVFTVPWKGARENLLKKPRKRKNGLSVVLNIPSVPLRQTMSQQKESVPSVERQHFFPIEEIRSVSGRIADGNQNSRWRTGRRRGRISNCTKRRKCNSLRNETFRIYSCA